MSRTRAAVALLGLLAVARLAAGEDWFNWRGPARSGVSDEKGLVSTLVARRARTCSGRTTSRRGPRRRVRRPRLHQRARRRRAHAPRAGGLLRRRHGQEAVGAPLPRLQHHGAVHARGLGRAGRRSRDGRRLRAERGRAARGPRPRRARRSGSTAWARSTAAARATAAARSSRWWTRTAWWSASWARAGATSARRASATWPSTSGRGPCAGSRRPPRARSTTRTTRRAPRWP